MMGTLLKVVIALLVSLFAGLALVVGLDFVARAFRWFGVDSPSTAWLLLGVLAGAVTGLAVGLRKAGRPLPRRRLGMSVVGLVAVLAIASALLPPAILRGETASMVRVMAEELNVRDAPDNGAAIVGRVTDGQMLRVLESSAEGDWYRVEVAGGARVRGWVGARYVGAVSSSGPD